MSLPETTQGYISEACNVTTHGFPVSVGPATYPSVVKLVTVAPAGATLSSAKMSITDWNQKLLG